MIRPSSPPATPAALTSSPSRVRHRVILFAVALAVIQYIDRVCISQAMPDIARDLNFSDRHRGLVFSAFGLAYALFEIPTGWLGDKIGARKVLLRVVLWWSFFTAATGWMWNYLSMAVTRFLFGAGEAGCFPNLTKAFSAWLPNRERTRAQALLWMGARWGGAFTPLLVVAVMAFVTWRQAFLLFALLGVLWAVAFYTWFRDNPRDHPRVNAAELELLKGTEQNVRGHGDVPWRRLIGSPTMWMLWGQYFCLSFGWYFYITWLPDYLQTARGLEIKSNVVMDWLASLTEGWMSPATTAKVLAAALAGIPLLFGGLGSMSAGIISNRWLARGGGVALVRRSFGFIGMAGAGALLMTSYYISDPLLAMLSMGLASLFNDLTMPGSWATCMDVGGKYAGTTSGSMNMMGNLGSMASGAVVGWTLDLTHRNWRMVFAAFTIVYFVGAFCWLFVNPFARLEKADQTSPTPNPS